jgi:Ribbon-helix-helix domain
VAGLRKKGRKPNSSDRLKKAQLSFYPEPEHYARLRELSARTGVPQQVYLRRGLEFVLQTYDQGGNHRTPSRSSAAKNP